MMFLKRVNPHKAADLKISPVKVTPKLPTPSRALLPSDKENDELIPPPRRIRRVSPDPDNLLRVLSADVNTTQSQPAPVLEGKRSATDKMEVQTQASNYKETRTPIEEEVKVSAEVSQRVDSQQMPAPHSARFKRLKKLVGDLRETAAKKMVESIGSQREHGKECAICLSCIADESLCKIACQHYFCWSCLKDWADVTNSCPLCKREFLEIIRIELTKDGENFERVISRIKVDARRQRIHDDDEAGQIEWVMETSNQTPSMPYSH
jgi:hypothetical protein